jgi:hypothetical protein
MLAKSTAGNNFGVFHSSKIFNLINLPVMVGWCAGCEFSEANYILEEAPSLAQFITRDSRVCCR